MRLQLLTGVQGIGSEPLTEPGKWTRLVEQMFHFFYQTEFSEFQDLPGWTLLLSVFRKV